MENSPRNIVDHKKTIPVFNAKGFRSLRLRTGIPLVPDGLHGDRRPDKNLFRTFKKKCIFAL